VLDEDTDTPLSERQPCPNCGSRARSFDVIITGEADVFTPTASDKATIFVAYPYKIPEDDYRAAFAAVEKEFPNVEFIYADDEITNTHVLNKIRRMISDATFSLFDITMWNANVALELGLAIGMELDYYILFDPTKSGPDVPADLGGIDRIQYASYAELTAGVSKLMRQQFGAPTPVDEKEDKGLMEQIEALKRMIPEIVGAEPGQMIGGIASSIDVPVEFAQHMVRPMIGEELETRGVRRGTRYYVKGQAPAEDQDDETDGQENLLSSND
jgi:hypothetical protein